MIIDFDQFNNEMRDAVSSLQVSLKLMQELREKYDDGCFEEHVKEASLSDTQNKKLLEVIRDMESIQGKLYHEFNK